MVKPVRVFIVDDHDDVRRALVERLSASVEVEVVGETGDAGDTLLARLSVKPHVALVETKRADGRGLEIVRRIATGDLGVQVIVLTSYPSDWERLSAFCAGAARYLLKDIDSADLIEQIRVVAAKLPPQ